jgi:hypothetical protein
MARRAPVLDLLRATPGLPPEPKLAQSQPKGTKAAQTIRAGLAGAVSKRRGTRNPATCDTPYEDDESEFLKAIARFKQETGKAFPTWSDALQVLKSLGYRKP